MTAIPGVQQQSTAMTQQASDFVLETKRAIASLELLLDSPGRNVEHSCAEMVRLVAGVQHTARIYAEQLALTASREPIALSQRRTATALGVSVNTLRRRLDRLGTDYSDPFSEDGE